jgi:hypothetical protein
MIMLENRKMFVPVKGQDKAQFKVKLSLRLINYHAMKTWCGVKVWLHAFLTSALDGDECSASYPGRIIPGETIPVPIRQEAGWASEPV